MTPIDRLILLVDRYCLATGKARATVSTRVFNDGKRIDRIMGGGDIGTRAYAGALDWFAHEWPEGAAWPEGVERPALTPTLSRAAGEGVESAGAAPAAE